jgi:hypothetical protein
MIKLKRKNKLKFKLKKKIKQKFKQKQNNINSNHKYLCYTNLLLVISIFFFLFNRQHIKSKIEYILASFVIVVIIFSQIFWNNPIKSSRIHKIDAFIAKIAIFSIMTYTLIYKFKLSFLFVILAVFICSYLSNYYSKKKWCSNKHLFCHGLLHIFCFLATLYTFYPKIKKI